MGEARDVIASRFGEPYTMPKGRVYKTNAKGAQEAHESIRPTSFERDPDSLAGTLKPEELRLYRLIWQRALASQMARQGARDDHGRARGRTVRAARDVDADAVRRLRPGLHRGSRRRRRGRRRGGPPTAGAGRGRRDDVREVTPTQHFTEPPPRFTEATLIKALEEHGIGRPSTYAATISTIVDRGYVRIEERRLHPELVAQIVTDLLVEHFGDYVDLEFTARMEEELDEIARGERAWVPLLHAFYAPAARPRRREAPRAAPQRLHDRGDRRGLLRGPPDGHPPRAQRPVPGLLAVPRAQGDAAAPRRRAAAPGGRRARSARSAARGRWSASAAGSGRSSAARATPTATTSRRKARRRPIRCPSRSSARRTTTAISSPRRARRTGNVFCGLLQLPQVRLHDELRAPRRRCTTPTTARWPARARPRSA